MTYPYTAPPTVTDGVDDMTASLWNTYVRDPLTDLLALLGNSPVGSAGSLEDFLLAEHNANGTHSIITGTAIVTSGGINSGTIASSGNISITSAVDDIHFGFNSAYDEMSYHSAFGVYMNSRGSFKVNIDANNDSTDAFFSIAKDNNEHDTGTELFRVQEDGKVGIGTAAPIYDLEIDVNSPDTVLAYTNFINVANSDVTVGNLAGIFFGQAVGSALGGGVAAAHTSRTVGDRATELIFYVMSGNSVIEAARLSPAANLTVQGSIVGLTGGGDYIGKDANNALRWDTAYGTFVNSAGNFKINIDADNDSSTVSFDVVKDVATYTGGTILMRINEAGAMFLNDGLNANMTQGLTINQGTASDQILAFKSSSIGQPITAVEADTYGDFIRGSATLGGLVIRGFAETGTANAFTIQAYVDDPNTVKTAAASAPIVFTAFEHNGAGAAGALSADANLAVFRRDATTAVAIIDEDGDLFIDGTSTAFDEHDDALLVRAVERIISPMGLIESQFDAWVGVNRADLERMNLIGEGGNFINLKTMAKLHSGAIWQLYSQVQELKEKIAHMKEM